MNKALQKAEQEVAMGRNDRDDVRLETSCFGTYW